MTVPRITSRRPTSPLSIVLDKRLTAYVAAASAAGIGILATSRVAEAEIVYTPANVSVGVGGTIPIDLNNDGIPDFAVVGLYCGHRSNCLVVNPLVTGNAIKGSGDLAAAGVFGIPVGPKGQFLTQFLSLSGYGSFVGFMANGGASYGATWSGGPWANTANRYLGLKFLIGGKIHYGWARMNVRIMRNRVMLTGYAYETIPNHQILEGHKQGVSASDLRPANSLAPLSERPATLGMLAQGADGLSIWRREEEMITQ